MCTDTSVGLQITHTYYFIRVKTFGIVNSVDYEQKSKRELKTIELTTFIHRNYPRKTEQLYNIHCVREQTKSSDGRLLKSHFFIDIF